MKKAPRAKTIPGHHLIQHSLLASARRRLAAFLVISLVASTFILPMVSLAQSKNAGRIREKIVRAESPLKPSSVSKPKRYERESEREREMEQRRRNSAQSRNLTGQERPKDRSTANLRPKELRLTGARPFNGDVRTLPQTKPVKREKPEREAPVTDVTTLGDVSSVDTGQNSAAAIEGNAPAPAPLSTFIGLDKANWGAGSPPDTVGDVGPNYFIQSVNSSVGIYDKSNGSRVAAFTLDALMSQGQFGNLCDTDNYGDPVVVYDTFEDRWIITDFAFKLDAQQNVINPPGAFQCFAVSKSGDPVAGGWNFYSINTAGGMGDYPKFGIWPDALFMTASMFDYAASGSFQNPRAYAFNKAQMYAGSPTVQVVSFDLPSSEFTVLPSNARLQTGTPPAGTPNYYAVVWNYTNAISIYKFKVNWDKISLSTFTGPFDSIAPASWINAPSGVGQSGTTQTLDTLAPRLMMQNQYTNFNGVESVWNTHTVGGSATTQAAVRYYQVGVTGGTVGSTPVQAATHNPDTTVNRFIPSLAVDRAGNMALGYSASSTSMFPSIRYAGRLASDAANTLSLTEQTLFAGTGSQTGINRWGDYAAMNLDPNGCTFWFTTEYYAATGTNWQTRIGSFQYPQCTPAGNGSVQGQVTASGAGTPISGATVSLGSRTTTTNANGFYTFSNIPAGTYPGMTASYPGSTSASASSIIVQDGGATTQDFSLSVAQASACLTDTTQSDFQNGVPTSIDLTTSPGNAILVKPVSLDQQMGGALSTSGAGFNATTWYGQTFVPAVTGTLQKADLSIFCSSCTGTAPNLTLSVRATSAGLPTGADLATATIPGNASGSSAYLTGTFATPPTLTAGTTYALIIRPVSNPSAGTYAVTTSSANSYASGQRVVSSNSGSTWGTPTGSSKDLGFHTYMLGGYTTSGNLISGLKDVNPAAGSIPTWGTLSWNATTPANTNIQFQAAASNNPNGPFNFVGPDGTAATYFTSGSSLARFNGLRFLRYKALFNGTSTATPTLADVTVCYTAAQAVSVGGHVTDGTNPISGVLMTLSGSSSATTNTDANGNYSFGGLTAGGNYTVTPSKSGLNFTPANRLYTNMVSSQSSADFTAAPSSYTIGGQVVRGGNGLSGVTMTLSGSSSAITTTDSNGNYTFSTAAGGNYTITPSKASYTFTPASRTYNALAGNQSGANFTARRTTVRSDFDGDGRSDVAVWEPSTGNWNVLRSSSNAVMIQSDWGRADLGDRLVPGDYDGDGKTDIAVFRPSEGNWYIIRSSDHQVSVKNWGTTGDIPVPGDYDGDEITDIAIFRLSEGNWYIRNSSTDTVTLQQWGVGTDQPVMGDYDGDGKTDIAIFRPSEGNWYIRNSSNGTVTLQQWGIASDKPVPADYDGDGKADIAVWRINDGNWHILNSGGGSPVVKGWGDNTDQVVPADYDGDGRADIAVFRPSDSNWYIIQSQTNTLNVPNMGTANDVTVTSAYIGLQP